MKQKICKGCGAVLPPNRITFCSKKCRSMSMRTKTPPPPKEKKGGKCMKLDCRYRSNTPPYECGYMAVTGMRRNSPPETCDKYEKR